MLQVLRTKEQPRDEQAGRDEHQKAPAAIGRRASRFRRIRAAGTVRSTSTSTPYRTMAAPLAGACRDPSSPPHRR